jgi:hypothetical protein
MTQVEVFGYGLIFATGICVLVWVAVIVCILLAGADWIRGKRASR